MMPPAVASEKEGVTGGTPDPGRRGFAPSALPLLTAVASEKEGVTGITCPPDPGRRGFAPSAPPLLNQVVICEKPHCQAGVRACSGVTNRGRVLKVLPLL